MVGDADRFEQLYRDHCVALLRYVASRLDAGSAEELVAECFLIAWRRRETLMAGRERAWLFAVAHGVVANERRSRQRRERLADKIQTHTPASSRFVSDHAQEWVDGQVVQAILDRLPTRQREALQLAEWDGLSASEAAQVMGCSVTAFRVRLHRARQRVATFYEQETQLESANAAQPRPGPSLGGEAS
jgi:RNA polymerase sigma-70 factor, ECF subfamily